MATIGVPVCAINTTNTGSGSCAFKRDKIIYAIAAPTSYVMTPAKALDILATLKTDTLAARGSRLFPIGAFTDSISNITEVVYDTAPNGKKIRVKNEVFDLRLEMRGATVCDQAALKTLRDTQKSLSYFFVQANGLLWGQSQFNTTTSQYEIVGVRADLVDVPMQMGATYDAASLSYLDFNFIDGRAIEDNEAWIDLNETAGLFSSVKTVLDEYRVTTLSLSKNAAAPSASGVFTVKLASTCSNSFGVDYASVIDKTLFSVTNMTTGLALVITTAVANAATGVITITLTTPPTAGTVMRVRTTNVADFTALGMKYFEGLNYVEFTNI